MKKTRAQSWRLTVFVIGWIPTDTFVTTEIPKSRLGEKEDRNTTHGSALIKANQSMIKKLCPREFGLHITLYAECLF